MDRTLIGSGLGRMEWTWVKLGPGSSLGWTWVITQQRPARFETTFLAEIGREGGVELGRGVTRYTPMVALCFKNARKVMFRSGPIAVSRCGLVVIKEGSLAFVSSCGDVGQG